MLSCCSGNREMHRERERGGGQNERGTWKGAGRKGKQQIRRWQKSWWEGAGEGRNHCRPTGERMRCSWWMLASAAAEREREREGERDFCRRAGMVSATPFGMPCFSRLGSAFVCDHAVRELSLKTHTETWSSGLLNGWRHFISCFLSQCNMMIHSSKELS